MTLDAPILIIQMQRMGDLVLSFPLMQWLLQMFPNRPLWVVGESFFFTPLLFLSPQAVYFDYEQAAGLKKQHFHLVVNLSHRPEAARLAAELQADAHFGPWAAQDGTLLVHGNWHLYRTSLVNNNYYNLFHWADLFALDLVPIGIMRDTIRHVPQINNQESRQGGQGARIGLFLGASRIEKHPDADFWAALTVQLLRLGHKPVLLGGEAEKESARAVARIIGTTALNLCGRFTIRELAEFIKQLDLFVTPDTGPMHVAAWIGVPVLNISLGPVNPWETGPFAPGHHIVRACIECTGCWTCSQTEPLCKRHFTAEKITALIGGILGDGDTALTGAVRRMPGLDVLVSGRDGYGLYTLSSACSALTGAGNRVAGASIQSMEMQPNKDVWLKAASRQLISRFWQAWFGELWQRMDAGTARTAWNKLQEHSPQEAGALIESVQDLARRTAQVVRRNDVALLYDQHVWFSGYAGAHPISGFLQMFLQNRQEGQRQQQAGLAMIENLLSLVTSNG